MNQPIPPRPTTAARTLRFACWVALVLILLPGQLLWLWLLRGTNLLTRESALIWGQLILGSATVALLALLKTTPADALRLSTRTSATIVIAGATLLQFAAVFLLLPVLSDDLFRYRIDGRMWLARTSPYATPPQQFLATHAPDAADQLVPYRDWRTVYPPVSQAVFATTRWLDDALTKAQSQSTATADPHPWRTRAATNPAIVRQTLVFRAVFALFAIGATLLLVRILTGAGDSPWWAVLLAWNPLLTLETGGMGHQDAIGLFLLLAIIHLARARHFRAAAVALALACGVKPVAALLLPFLWRQTHEQHSFRAGRRMLLVFALACAVIFLPPLAWQHGWIGWRQSLAHFGQSWEANGYLYESFKSLFGQGDQGRQMVRAKDAARLLAFLAVLATGLFLWQSRARLAEAGYWLFMVLLLCAPVAYPWYLIWVLAFIPLLRGPHGYAGLVWAATAAFSYTLWRDADWIWSVRPNWLTAEYLPVLCVLAIEAIRLARVVPMRRILTPQLTTNN